MDLLSALREVVPALQSAGEPERAAYATDLWPRRLIALRDGRQARDAPAVVVWPEDQESVVRVIEFARREGIPIVPYGAGSGVCGAISPDPRSIVVDLKRMHRWQIQQDGPTVFADAGALGITFEEELALRGFTVGHFPSSILCSTVGGWVAARGAGQCSSRYGKIEDMVVSADCVLGTGEVVTLRRRRNGPCPLSLFIGSEGTLGIVTRVELRLHPAPTQRIFAAYDFSSIGAALTAMRRLFQEGLRPAVARLYDPLDSWLLRRGAVSAEHGGRRGRRGQQELVERIVRRLHRASSAFRTLVEQLEKSDRARSTLVLVFEGTNAEELAADAERAESVCVEEGGEIDGPELGAHWFEHRYSVSFRQSKVFRAGAFNDTMEVSAPWSKLESVYHSVRHAIGADAVVMAHFSHAYPDGSSIYFTFVSSGRDDVEAEQVYDRIWRSGIRAALDAGATLSHHHGVGRSKAAYLDEALGGGSAVLSRVLSAWDPSGVLNPGCLLPTREVTARGGRDVLPRGITLDEESLLVSADGATPLAAVESALDPFGLGLGLGLAANPGETLSVADFIGRGFPGAGDAWADPVDQVLAGFEAHVGGLPVALAPAPRRATGPDLSALFSGTQGELGDVDRATLRVHRRGAPPARALPFHADRNPPLAGSELQAWQAIVQAFRRL